VKIAIINAGSSSLKYKLFQMPEGRVLQAKNVENIGEKGSKTQTHKEALASLNIDFASLDAIGHRVVHGGEKFQDIARIDDTVRAKIRELIPLAPLHNGANLEGINEAILKAPNLPQFAVFDTGFHSSMPQEAYLYALPYALYEKHHIRRYGFHGSSHAYVSKKASLILNKALSELNLITLHLGNGASACAIEGGKSIDTSMGFTPLEGLVMGSRSGDIDPAIVLYLQRELQLSIEEVDTMLNAKSGLMGLCNEKDVRKISESKEAHAKVALDIMIRRVQKYIGSYMALLDRVDAIVFTGGIGENSAFIREKIMDKKMFENLEVLVIQTDEELQIAKECENFLNKKGV